MKRFLVALAVGATVLGGVTAFAASLGGVTVNNFGAGAAVVASCDTDGVDVRVVPNNSRPDGRYALNVSIANVAASCNGKFAEFTLFDKTGTFIGGAAFTINSTAQSSTGQSGNLLDNTGEFGVKAERIDHVTVFIAG
jgi:hypothetical protein